MDKFHHKVHKYKVNRSNQVKRDRLKKNKLKQFRIPVIINNRNLLTWPRAMVEKMIYWYGIGDIIIIDNASTYEPLLNWYKTIPFRVVRLKENLGHQAPWSSGVVAEFGSIIYAVTDPDLDLTNTNNRAMTQCTEFLLKHPSVGKVGLSLEWKDVPIESSYFCWVNSYERNRQNNSRIVDGVMIDVAIDTTFAIYNQPNYFIGGCSSI